MLQPLPITTLAMQLLGRYVTKPWAGVIQNHDGHVTFFACPKCQQPAVIVLTYIGGRGHTPVLQCLSDRSHFDFISCESALSALGQGEK